MKVRETTVKTNVYAYTINLDSNQAPEFMDITDQVEECVRQSEVQNGLAVVFSRHTTAAIKINEHEPLLLKDMERFLEKTADRNGYYHHNDFNIRTVNMDEGECPNGHAHCQHLFLGSSETIPIVNGQMHLGRWQCIFMIELDRPRPREVIVQILGV